MTVLRIFHLEVEDQKINFRLQYSQPSTMRLMKISELQKNSVLEVTSLPTLLFLWLIVYGVASVCLLF
jgi:hypothetical protein